MRNGKCHYSTSTICRENWSETITQCKLWGEFFSMLFVSFTSSKSNSIGWDIGSHLSPVRKEVAANFYYIGPRVHRVLTKPFSILQHGWHFPWNQQFSGSHFSPTFFICNFPLSGWFVWHILCLTMRSNERKFKFLTQPHFRGSADVSRPSHAPVFLGKASRFKRKRGDFFGGGNHRMAPQVGIWRPPWSGYLLLGNYEPTPRYSVQWARRGDLNEISRNNMISDSHCIYPMVIRQNTQIIHRCI